jgi:hypothetical protein
MRQVLMILAATILVMVGALDTTQANGHLHASLVRMCCQ